jgi:hypothetical protein
MENSLTAAVEPPATTALRGALLDFQARFNSNNRVKKLVKNWDRRIFVEATDSGAAHVMVIKELLLGEIHDGMPEEREETLVHLQADEATLIDIFYGEYNPATALIDGVLAVFSSDRDKVKLEAMAMLIWGL